MQQFETGPALKASSIESQYEERSAAFAVGSRSRLDVAGMICDLGISERPQWAV